MIGRLLRILAAAEEPVDAAELADALWLAERLPEPTGPVPRTPRPATVPPIPPFAPAQPQLRIAPGAKRADSPDGTPSATMHLTTAGAGAGTGRDATAGTVAGTPAVPAIRDSAAITRALRPLRARIDSATYGIVDEIATANRIADTGLWVPELLPEPERWLELILIIDKSASMVVWQRSISEFQGLLTQLAAFRRIHVVTVNTDKLSGIPGGAVSPAGGSLVLFLSDCVGRGWTEGNVLPSLERLAKSVPVAIVHMLPQRLWGGCGLSFAPVQMSAEPGTRSRLRLAIKPRGSQWETGADGLPVPVLEFSSRWLGPWAAMLAGGPPISGMATFTRSTPMAIQRHDPVTPSDRVTLFRAVASPLALRLASYLAAAPLSLPVMRLVQHVMLPESATDHLAEVFLSGLLCRVAQPGQGTVEFEFYPGVREILLSGLRRAEALRVFRAVSEYIGQRIGSPLEFPALFATVTDEATQADPAVQGQLTEPFAAVALTVLRSVGGRYRAIADEIAKAPAGARIPALAGVGRTIDSAEQSSASASSAPIVHGGEVTVPDSADPITPASHPVLWRGVPSKNLNFTGREEFLLSLRSQLSAGMAVLVPIALHGLGGVGKTQIALEYVYRFSADYDLVCWVSGEVPLQMRSDLAKLAPDLDIPAGGGDLERTLMAVCDALRRQQPYRRWLVVVDNAGDPEEVRRYLPQRGGHILITSRNQAWREIAHTFEVPTFTRAESISLIRQRNSAINEEDADRLADRLGDLPLAVEQAAAWQADSGMPADRYLALLDKRMSLLLAENPPQGYPQSVVAAWSLACEDLESRSPEAAALVQLCAFLGPEPIPYRLLWAFRHASDLPPDLASMLQDDVHFHRAVRQVGRYALLNADQAQETLTEHRLVQAVLRERLSPEKQLEMVRLVWKLLIVANPGRPDDPRNWEMLSSISRHLRASGIIQAEDRGARNVVLDQIRFLYNQGDQRGSRELAEEAVRAWRASSDEADEQTLVARRFLGIALRELGFVQQARVLNEDTYERARRALGEEHEHTLVTANSYACDLRIIGTYEKALDLDEGLFEKHQRVFGEDDENTLRSSHNLAVDYRLNGRFQQAYDQDMQTLQRRRRALGERRWETWSSAGAVGRDLRFLGRYEQSAKHLEDAIDHSTQLLDLDHPEVVRLRTDYAATLRRMGRLQDAKTEAEACYELNLRRLGETHNYTLWVMTVLAEVLRLLGDNERAIDLAERVVEASPATYGAEHILITTAEHNYAIQLRAVNDLETAYAVDRRVNERFRAEFGPQRRRTTSSDVSLALDHALLGDAAAARVILDDVVIRSENVRGASHPRTLFYVTNLARVLDELGDAEAASRKREAALEPLRRDLGATHPEVALAEAGVFVEDELEVPDR